MRVCFIGTVIDRHNAGISQYSRNILIHLKKIAPENEYFVIHQQKSKDDVYSGTKEIIFPKFIPLKLRAILINIYLLFRKFDVVFNPSILGPHLFPIKAPVVTTVHDLIPFKLPETRKWFSTLYYRFFSRRILKNSSHLITVSLNSKKDMEELLNIPSDKISVIYGAAADWFKKQSELDEFRNKYKITYPYFLFVGTVEPRKNLVRIMKAFAKCRRQFPQFHLAIVGSLGWKYDAELKLIKEMDGVHFFENVPNEDVPKFYSSAEALVFPSLYEGFGLPILEAMACGCPVITARNSSLPEVAGDAALYVDEFSEEDISAKMSSIVQDKKLKNELVKKGYEQARKFSWSKNAKETLAVLHKVVK